MEYTCQNPDCKHREDHIGIVYLEPEIRKWWCKWCNEKYLKLYAKKNKDGDSEVL